MNWIYWFKTFKTELHAGIMEKRLKEYHQLTSGEKMTTQIYRTKKGNYGIKFIWN